MGRCEHAPAAACAFDPRSPTSTAEEKLADVYLRGAVAELGAGCKTQL